MNQMINKHHERSIVLSKIIMKGNTTYAKLSEIIEGSELVIENGGNVPVFLIDPITVTSIIITKMVLLQDELLMVYGFIIDGESSKRNPYIPAHRFIELTRFDLGNVQMVHADMYEALSSTELVINAPFGYPPSES